LALTWLITGVNGGFGREMAEQLLARGDRVAGTVRRPGTVADLATRHGSRFWSTVLDLTDAPAIGPVVDRAFAELGRIDVVVNNAGYGQFGAAEALTEAQVRQQIDTNLLGPILLTRAALPHLRAQDGGRLLAMSSYGGQATHPGASLYHASKWGLEGFFDSLAAEVAPFGIGVTIVEPGSARTGFRAAAGAQLPVDAAAYAGTPMGTLRDRLSDPAFVAPGDPARMARAIIDSVAQDPAPRRLVLGSDAYAMLEAALVERLAQVQAQKNSAAVTDVPAGG
jgi:NAD(P)-dependent dehydrogenase (short-subunit alcohol dehydrogenase family)